MSDTNTTCSCLVDFMKAQRDIITRHIDEHKWLRHIENKNDASVDFIESYGWIIREMYCTKVCGKRDTCEIANRLSKTGDLLRDKLPKKD